MRRRNVSRAGRVYDAKGEFMTSSTAAYFGGIASPSVFFHMISWIEFY